MDPLLKSELEKLTTHNKDMKKFAKALSATTFQVASAFDALYLVGKQQYSCCCMHACILIHYRVFTIICVSLVLLLGEKESIVARMYGCCANTNERFS